MADDKKTSLKTEAAEIDAALVRSLADILNDTDLTEIEVERGDLKIKVKREIAVAAAPVQYAAQPAPAPRPRPCPATPPPWSPARAKR